MSVLKLFHRAPGASDLGQRGETLRGRLARAVRRTRKAKPLPAAGSAEAVAAYEAACTAFDRLTHIPDAEYAALRIGDTYTLWTTRWVEAARRGDFSRFSMREFEAAWNTTPAELSDLLVLTTRRDLQFAEAEQRTNLRTLYALAYPNGRDEEPEPEPTGDHAHVVIAEHRAAYAVWKPLGDAWNEMPGGGPWWKEAEEAQAEPYRVQAEAFGELIDTRASTVAGLVALAAYLPGAVFEANCVEVEEDARRALRSMCEGVIALFGEEADAALVALEAEFLATDAAFRAAVDAMHQGQDIHVKPPVPPALRVWSNDWMFNSIPRPPLDDLPNGKCRYRPYGEVEVEILRAQPCMAVYVGGSGGVLQPDGHGRLRPDTQAQKRADAIVAAYDEHQVAIEAARVAANLPALETAYDTATVARDAVLQRVREASARGFAGLAVKARIAANMGALDDPKAEGLKHYDPDDSSGLFIDLAGDVLTLTGGLPDAHRPEP